MKRIAHVARVSLVAALLTAGCSPTPTPATPTPTPAPQPTPPSLPVGSLSITVSASPVRAGVMAHFTIRIDPPDAVSALSLDFGDGTTATFEPVHASIDVTHEYRL